MEQIFVKPKEGVKIRRPDTGRFLSDEGEQVPDNTFWRRRVTEGDAVQSKNEKQHVESSAKKFGGDK